MLLAELQQKETVNASKGKVSVVMPFVARQTVEVETAKPVETTSLTIELPIEEIKQPTPVVEEEPVVVEAVKEPEPVVEIPPIELEEKVAPEPEPEPVIEEPAPVKPVELPADDTIVIPKPEPQPEQQPEKAKEGFLQSSWLFDTAATIPTLPVQEPKEVFELNDVMTADDESLNDRLKEQKTEVAAKLQGAPIRDLKKAIGINDRFLFINELFRGDEDMYERSIKTINAFSIYPEAEYWIQRELKVKIGWTEGTEAVKQFDQLVKRRFS